VFDSPRCCEQDARMRFYRNQSSSKLPHSAPSVPFKSSRISCLGMAVALALLVLPSPARAQPRDPREAALDDFVAARMLTTKCPSWQLDLGPKGGFPISISNQLTGKPADAMPASSTAVCPTMRASCRGCPRSVPVRRQKRHLGQMVGSGQGG
jgi:hypothetical protein